LRKSRDTKATSAYPRTYSEMASVSRSRQECKGGPQQRFCHGQISIESNPRCQLRPKHGSFQGDGWSPLPLCPARSWRCWTPRWSMSACPISQGVSPLRPTKPPGSSHPTLLPTQSSANHRLAIELFWTQTIVVHGRDRVYAVQRSLWTGAQPALPDFLPGGSRHHRRRIAASFPIRDARRISWKGTR
jgi:hypothetical protein